MSLVQPTNGHLRQGDVCVVSFFPLWDVTEAGVQIAPGSQKAVLQMQDRMVQDDGAEGGVLLAVCSQCCDLRRPKKRSGILVAPLRHPPIGPHDTERAEEIRRSIHPDHEGRWSHVSLFPLEVGDALVVVDFSRMTSMAPPKQATAQVLDSRRWSLIDDAREQFRKKVAALVGRPPSDEEEDDPPGPSERT